MKAVGFTEFGGPEVMRVFEHPEPRAGRGQVRIKVAASSLNPSDKEARSGNMRGMPNFPESAVHIVGWDAAGVIDEVGDGVRDELAIGRDVIAVLHPEMDRGAQAEYVVAPEESVVLAPSGATAIEASTLLMNAMTSRIALDMLELEAGGTVAITGAAGATGGFAVELAKARGLTVIADAAEADRDLIAGFGADHLVPRGPDFGHHVRDLMPAGADGVVDNALIPDASLAAVRDGGTVSSLRGQSIPNERGVHWARPWIYDGLRDTVALEQLRDQAEAGALSLRVAQVFDPSEIASAHRRLAQGGLRGRLVMDFEKF